MANVEELKTYYKELLLYQYIDSTKIRSTIDVLSNAAIADLVALSVQDSFDINTAVGEQLDIIGEYIGISRIINVAIVKTYMILVDQTSLPASYPGFTDYTDSSLNYEYSIYNIIPPGYSTAYLNDDEYRLILKIKIYTNHLDHSLYAINNALYSLFGSAVYVKDFANMTMAYITTDIYLSMIRVARDLSVLPTPMSVGIMGVFSQSIWDDLWNIYSDSDAVFDPIPLDMTNDYPYDDLNYMSIVNTGTIYTSLVLPFYADGDSIYEMTVRAYYPSVTGATGNLNARLIAADDTTIPSGKPTGQSIAYSTNTIEISALTPDIMNEIKFNFSYGSLVDGQCYALLIDQYPTSNGQSVANSGSGYFSDSVTNSLTRVGQIFTTPSMITSINNIQVAFYAAVSSETNLVYVDIWDVSTITGKPTNIIGVSNPIAKNTFPTTYGAFRTFTFPSTIILSASTKYAWTIRVVGSFAVTLAGLSEDPGSYADGNSINSLDGGETWYSVSATEDVSKWAVNLLEINPINVDLRFFCVDTEFNQADIFKTLAYNYGTNGREYIAIDEKRLWLYATKYPQINGVFQLSDYITGIAEGTVLDTRTIY